MGITKHKFTTEDVTRYREAFSDGSMTRKDIKSDSGRSRTTVANMLRGATYTDIPMPKGIERKLLGHNRLFTNNEVKELRTQYHAGHISIPGLMKVRTIDISTAKRMLYGETYKEVAMPERLRICDYVAERMLSPQEVVYYRQAYNDGILDASRISAATHIAMGSIKNMLWGSTYDDCAGPIAAKRAAKTPKWTKRQVVAMRVKFAARETTQAALRRKWGVAATTVSNMLEGLTYRKVGGPITKPKYRQRVYTNRKLSEYQVISMRNRYATDPNSSIEGFAFEHGMTPVAIKRILQGKSYADIDGPIWPTLEDRNLSLNVKETT